jgi:serine/threonine-protein kinase
MSTVLHSRPEVVVPKLEGKSLMDALTIVSPLDLSIQQEGTDYDESLPAGTIIRQQPASGMKVRAGRALRVVVSKGGQVVFVPGVLGKPLIEAQSVLAAAGLQMGAITEIFSTDTAKGSVLAQNPSSGTVVTRGALIDVDVSKGVAPVGAPLVPNFIGRSVASAEDWAKTSGAELAIKEDRKAVGVPGTVVKQDPAGGQPVLEGESIELTVVPQNAASPTDRLTYVVPGSGGEVVVRIMARDNRGETQAYEGKHPGGFTLTIPISVKSPTRFRIYVDDLLTEERLVEPAK